MAYSTYRKIKRGNGDSKHDKSILENILTDISLLRGKPLIREETPKEGNKFHLFASNAELFKIVTGAPRAPHFHEVIIGWLPQKLKFDIDIDCTKPDCDIKDFEQSTELIENIKYKIILLFQAEYDIEKPPEIKQYESHGKTNTGSKFSYHLVIQGYCVANHLEANGFTKQLLSLLTIQEKKYLDFGVNKEIQNFRLLHSCKLGSKRIKKIDEETTLENFENSLISHTENCEILPEIYSFQDSKLKGKNEFQTAELVGDIAIILDKLRSPVDYLNGFAYTERKGRLLLFERKFPSHCHICGETHHKDSTLMVGVSSQDNALFIYCRHAPGKYILVKNDNQSSNSVVYQPDKTEPIPTEEYDENVLREFPNAKTFILQANMKMGKTKALMSFISKNYADSAFKQNRIVIVSFRQTFSENAKSKFPDFVLYNQTKGDLNQPRVIVQMESLHRLMTNTPVDLLILDESESILEQFNSGLFRDFAKCFRIFQWLLKYSSSVIAMDAFISRRTYNIMQRFRPNGIIFHRNTHKNATEDTIHITQDKTKWALEIKNQVAAGHNIAINSNSLELAKTIYLMIQKQFPDLEIKLYSSETSIEEKREHFANVDDYWSKFRVLIYTPTVSAGVSFEREHFDSVFGYFTDVSCGVETCLQMLGRIRNVKSHQIYLCINSTPKDLPTTSEDIRDVIEHQREELFQDMTNGLTLLDYEINKNGTRRINENDFYHIFLENRINRNQSLNYFQSKMIHLIKLTGANVVEFKANQSYKDLTDMSTIMDNCRSENKNQINSDISISPDIDDETANEIKEKLRNQKDIAREEMSAFEKYKLRKRYNWAGEIDPEFVEKYKDRKVYQIYHNLRSVLKFGTGVKQGLNEYQKEEREKYETVQNYIDENPHIDLVQRYNFSNLRQNIHLLHLCGFTDFMDEKWVSGFEMGENLKKNNKEIYEITRRLSVIHELKSPMELHPEIIEDFITKHLVVINRLISKTFGCKITKVMKENNYHICRSKWFSYSSANTSLPMVVKPINDKD